MHLSRLTLQNVRTFRRLDLPLASGRPHVIWGENASGKTNLLESIALLATARLGHRRGTDADLISWDAVVEDPLPTARIAGQVETRGGTVQLEIAITAALREPEPGAPEPGAMDIGEDGPESAGATRRFRVNGVARRASDLVGHLRVVLFSADDLLVLEGPPGGRRRFLDLTLTQIQPGYVRALQRYQRVLQQRNSLLRRLQERRAPPHELDFWDDELAAAGAEIIAARAALIEGLGAIAEERHRELAPREERAPAGRRERGLALGYRPALPPGAASGSASLTGSGSFDRAALVPWFAERLREQRPRDIASGVSRFGPHRDELLFQLGGREAAASASRGQLRGIMLAMRLAEVALFTERTGDPPVLLLDDVLSELDAERRARVLATAYEVDQVLLTTPDSDLPHAIRYWLHNGALDRLE